jgi:hypothetical protein
MQRESSQANKEMEMKSTYTTIDEYIATFPADVQAIPQNVRATIRKSAPGHLLLVDGGNTAQ